MHMKFDYPEKVREDFLTDVVKPMVEQRKRLGLTQEDVDALLGVADRLVSKWECGVRTPTSFHLYCWSDALEGRMVFLPNKDNPLPCVDETIVNVANDNLLMAKAVSNDNIPQGEQQEVA